MKQAKKLLAFLLVAVLVISLGSLSAFAAEEETEDYSITIKNTNEAMSINGKQYVAYKVFDLSLGQKTTDTEGNVKYGAYAYSIKNDSWAWDTIVADATTTDGVITTKYGFTLTPTAADPDVYNVDGTGMTEDQARELADALAKVLPDEGGVKSAAAANETATINLTEPGYYAVYGVVVPKDPSESPVEEVIAAVALQSTDPNVEIQPKASIPTLDKKIKAVKEGNDAVTGAVLDEAGKAAVAKVGSTVSFELDSVTPDLTGYSDYTFTFSDTVTAGLDYVTNSFKLTINDTTEEINPTIDGRSFTLTIPYTILEKYDAGKAIVLTYDCTVNSSALTMDYENNTAKLTYSDNPYNDTTNETPEKKTYVIDINLDVLKVDAKNNETTLDGAKFKLYREVSVPGEGEDAEPTTQKQYYKWADNKVTWVEEAQADVFETDTNGKFKTQVRGLDKGEYFLLETEAPSGYNVLKEAVKVVISVSEANDKVIYTATYSGAAATVTNGEVNLASETQAEKQPVAEGTIGNNKGTELPSTGGIGTTIFYVVGGVLLVGAGVLLVTKKRAGGDN